MYTLLTLALLALTPSTAHAGVDLVSMSSFETDCRAEMNLLGVAIKPGKTKGDLRRCIRLKTSASRTRTESKRKKASSQIQEEEILQKVIDRQQNTEKSRYSTDPRTQYNLACREKLGIGAKDVVRAGPKLGTLKRCVERMTSEASRTANLKRRRDTVRQRSSQVGASLKEKKEAELDAEIKRMDNAQRTRLQTQIRANPRELKMIRESYRVRSFFTNDPIETRAIQKMNAQDCRKVPAKEWGACIREALSGK
jgi:hypothetical protein